MKAECGGLRGTDCGMEVAGPGAGPGGETIANGRGGNSTGHGSADHMLIGGLVAECLILKALRSDTHIVSFLAVKISILAGKSSRTNFLPQAFSLCWDKVAGPHTNTQVCTGNTQICTHTCAAKHTCQHTNTQVVETRVQISGA